MKKRYIPPFACDISSTMTGRFVELNLSIKRCKEEITKLYEPIFDFMKKKDFLICFLLSVSIGMNFFQVHIIKSQFDFLEEDVTLFRKSMNLMDSLETANHGLFIKLMELKEYQLMKETEKTMNCALREMIKGAGLVERRHWNRTLTELNEILK